MDELQTMLEIETVYNVIRKGRLRWMGHVLRKGENNREWAKL